MRHTIAVIGAALALAAPASGQETSAAVVRRMDVEKIQTELARATVESRITRGAPYSGEAVTETIQVLSDGNRIARKSSTRIYRDSEGRTRRENLSSNGEVTTINISDPVGESTYVLYPQTKVAHRNGVIMVGRGGQGSAEGRVEPGSTAVVMPRRSPDGSASVYVGDPSAEAARRMDVEKAAAAAAATGSGAGSGGGFGRGGGVGVGAAGGGGARGAGPGAPTMERTAMAGVEGKKEDLGQQMVEGVLATGSRYDDDDPGREHRQRQANRDRVGAVVLGRPESAHLHEALGPSQRRDHLSPDERHPGRAAPIAVRSAARLHAAGLGHPAQNSAAAVTLQIEGVSWLRRPLPPPQPLRPSVQGFTVHRFTGSQVHGFTRSQIGSAVPALSLTIQRLQFRIPRERRAPCERAEPVNLEPVNP